MADEFKEVVRIVNSDIKGERNIYAGLRSIKGISYSFCNAICNLLNMDSNKKLGSLSDEEIRKIEDVVKNPAKYNIPHWLFNRKKDYDSGEDKHVISTDIKFQQESDIKRLKGIKSYRGMRHAAGLPVRGQRTRGHFRKGATVGVSKKGIKKGRV